MEVNDKQRRILIALLSFVCQKPIEEIEGDYLGKSSENRYVSNRTYIGIETAIAQLNESKEVQTMSLYKQVLLIVNGGYSAQEIINEFAEQGMDLTDREEVQSMIERIIVFMVCIVGCILLLKKLGYKDNV